MLKTYRIIPLVFILCLLTWSYLPSQAVAQCNTLDACEAAATDQGLQLGGVMVTPLQVHTEQRAVTPMNLVNIKEWHILAPVEQRQR